MTFHLQNVRSIYVVLPERLYLSGTNRSFVDEWTDPLRTLCDSLVGYQLILIELVFVAAGPYPDCSFLRYFRQSLKSSVQAIAGEANFFMGQKTEDPKRTKNECILKCW